MRRVLPQNAPFFQRFHYQRNLPLLQITHATVHQLGAAARRSLPKIMLLQQQRFVAARCCVERHADTGRAASDNNHAQRFALRTSLLQHLRAFRRDSPPRKFRTGER